MRSSEMSRAPYALWQAGVTYKLGLPVGFAIQPSLLYQAKGAKTTDRYDIQTGYIELPVSVQWGPDLLVCRPFVDVTPFIGYAVSNKMYSDGVRIRPENRVPKPEDKWKAVNRFEYGVGVGLGLEVWRFQLIGRYMWNFERLYDKEKGADIVGTYVSNAFSRGKYRGFMLSLSYLFGGGRKR